MLNRTVHLESDLAGILAAVFTVAGYITANSSQILSLVPTQYQHAAGLIIALAGVVLAYKSESSLTVQKPST